MISSNVLVYTSPIGKIVLTESGGAVKSADLPAEGDAVPCDCGTVTDTLAKCCAWFDGYFKGEDNEVDFPLDPSGSDYQKAVWKAACEVKFGETASYAEIARKAALNGKKPCARAAGGALHRNPIIIIVPCHRIIGADSSMTGYAGGIAIKEYLLLHEKNAKKTDR